MSDIHTWNTKIIAEFRANAGRVAWSEATELAQGRPVPTRLPGFAGEGVPIILVHHTGARSGHARITPLVYRRVGASFAVFASAGGSPSHPAWYHNLLANPTTTIEVGTDTLPVEARIAAPAERDRIWAAQVALMPKFAEFEAASGRRTPIVLFDPRTLDS